MPAKKKKTAAEIKAAAAKKAAVAAAKAKKDAAKKALAAAIKAAEILDDPAFSKVVQNELRDNAVYMDDNTLRIVKRQRDIAARGRIAATNRCRSSQQGKSNQAIALLLMIANTNAHLEKALTNVMTCWADAHPLARFFLQFLGIGPVTLASVLSYINMQALPSTAGHLWSYFGMDPSIRWIGKKFDKMMLKQFGVSSTSTKPLTEKQVDDIIGWASGISGVKKENLHRSHQLILMYDHKERITRKNPLKATGTTVYQTISRRPWNAGAKKDLHLLVDGLVKVGGRCVGTAKEGYYGRLYLDRKKFEIERDETGHYAQAAATLLANTPKSKEATYWKDGRLSKGHIDMKARRWVKKIVLSHIHHVAHVWRYDCVPPKPYAVTHLGHAHVILPPDIETVDQFLVDVTEEIKEKYGVTSLPEPEVKSNRGPSAYELFELEDELDDMENAG